MGLRWIYTAQSRSGGIRSDKSICRALSRARLVESKAAQPTCPLGSPCAQSGRSSRPKGAGNSSNHVGLAQGGLH